MMARRAEAQGSTPRDQEQVTGSAKFENCYRPGTPMALPLPPPRPPPPRPHPAPPLIVVCVAVFTLRLCHHCVLGLGMCVWRGTSLCLDFSQITSTVVEGPP